LRNAEVDLAMRYVAADNARESNLAPTVAMKLDFANGFSVRGSFTTTNRFPTPHMSRQVMGPATPGVGVDLEAVFDPLRKEKYGVQSFELLYPDLRTEEAVTQTAGIVFRRGKTHRLRAALDFVDTRKVNELIPLDAQMTLNLEPILPDRITRGPLAPGDPFPVGRVESIMTGRINAAWRHSLNWNGALDYSWTECFGGSLELYGRLVYFQRYERQVFADSPIVDELRRPEVGGLLKYRAKFGGGWSNRSYGFGVDGHYYHSRVLPIPERSSQRRSSIKPFLQFDAYVQSDLTRWLPWKSSRYGLRGQLRVNNVLDAGFPSYPNESSGAGVQPYGDWRGRTYSLSLTATF
jgi:iron complex outermembrane recepter protein